MSDKREGSGPLMESSLAFDFYFFLFLPGGALYFLLLTPLFMDLKNYRYLGPSSLSRPFVPPTTNQCK
jgi:hypothetical protein